MTEKLYETKYDQIHCIAHCHKCDWQNQEYRADKAKMLAKKHTIDTGHTTMVEKGIAFKYSLEGGSQ